MRRRSFLKTLAAAPVAATVKAEEKKEPDPKDIPWLTIDKKTGRMEYNV